MKRFLISLLLCAACAPLAEAQVPAGRKMTIADLFAFQRLSDPQISPDGQWVVYVAATVSLEKNQVSSSLWLAPTAGGAPKRLTTHTKSDRHPRWSPNGKQILFESSRSGSNQLWIIDVDGGEGRQLTDIATGASTGLWSPDGGSIGFVSEVYPEYSTKPYKDSNALNKKRLDKIAARPVKARVFSRLFFRHWNSYVEDRRQHLYVIPATGGTPLDVTPGDWDAYPTSSTFSLGDDFTFSPDSKYLVFTGVPKKNAAWSTNYDVFLVPVSGGKSVCLTTDNPAADGAPRFSPDGKWLAYRAQAKPGYEADRWQLYLIDWEAANPGNGGDAGKGALPKRLSVTESFDGWVEDYVWAPDSKTIYFLSEKNAHMPLFAVSVADRKVRTVVDKHSQQSPTISRDGKLLAFGRVAMTFPTEIFVHELATGKERNISRANKKLLGELRLPSPESVTVTGAGGIPMQMWILKPPGFDPQKKWPLVYLVHGGPQGAWADSWSFRWCPELWAAQGYVVALPNPRGSTGFGQDYVRGISGDWGGKCFEDLMAGVAYLEKQPYIDRDRMASAGASFGGYMMNWFAGHTDKFKTLITHAGVYNFDSMYATTEELWFDEFEHGGTPWENPKEYNKFSPHRFAKNFKTPMLIIHNDRDFRVPVSEGLQLFTTLQRLGIPSRMINFPDEDHFVLRPRNSEFWHREVFAWLKKYCPPGGR
jgi:dipeptidyl aminopeptidase/acylaminoacyl peptidase